MKDWKLAAGVLVLVVIDLIILLVYTIVVVSSPEGVELRETLNRENPSTSEEVRTQCPLQM